MAADVAVFDPATIIDHATFDEPTRPSEGIRFVFVNGRLAVRDGRPIGTRAGQVLRKAPHMSIRPMNGVEKRGALRRVTSGPVRVVVDVTQARGTRAATGTFRLTQQADGIALEMKAFGQLQAARNWATFTGMARLRPSEPERSVIVVLDGRELIVTAGDFSFTTRARRP
jgi:hypothetical protein